MPDPKLQTAINEIEAVLRKHDIAGLVMLQSQTHGHFLQVIDPTWSCAKFDKMPGGAVALRVRCKLEDFPNKDAQKKCLEETCGMVMTFIDVSRDTGEQMTRVAAMLGKHVEIQHSTRSERL